MPLKNLLFITVLTILLSACRDHNRNILLATNDKAAQKNYNDMLYKESKKNVRNDSLLYGIFFQMPDTTFYSYCTKMFKKGIFNGGYDYEVEVHITDAFERPVQLRFYPVFEKSVITELPCRFSYINANVYKKEDRANVLLNELIPVIMKWYGGNIFVEMPTHNPLKGPTYIKIDANRQITIAEGDNVTEVEVNFKDLKPAGNKKFGRTAKHQ
jgi:hypothetical protein